MTLDKIMKKTNSIKDRNMKFDKFRLNYEDLSNKFDVESMENEVQFLARWKKL